MWLKFSVSVPSGGYTLNLLSLYSSPTEVRHLRYCLRVKGSFRLHTAQCVSPTPPTPPTPPASSHYTAKRDNQSQPHRSKHIWTDATSADQCGSLQGWIIWSWGYLGMHQQALKITGEAFFLFFFSFLTHKNDCSVIFKIELWGEIGETGRGLLEPVRHFHSTCASVGANFACSSSRFSPELSYKATPSMTLGENRSWLKGFAKERESCQAWISSDLSDTRTHARILHANVDGMSESEWRWNDLTPPPSLRLLFHVPPTPHPPSPPTLGPLTAAVMRYCFFH